MPSGCGHNAIAKGMGKMNKVIDFALKGKGSEHL